MTSLTVAETGHELVDCSASSDARDPRRQAKRPHLPETMVGTPLLQKPAERPSGSSLGLNRLLAARESVTRRPRIPDGFGSLDPLFGKCRTTLSGSAPPSNSC